MSLSPSRPAELVAALRNDNMFWRLTAQRLIVERRQTDVVPALIAIVDDRSVDAIGLNSPAVHALWTLHGLGVLDGRDAAALAAATRALSHPAGGVRKAAQSVLPASSTTLDALMAANAFTDPDLNVRLNALLVASRLPSSAAAGRALYAVSKRPEVTADEWLPEAVWIAATRHKDGFLEAHAAEVGLTEYTRTSVRGARGDVPGAQDWSSPALDETGWFTVPAPRVWADTPLGDLVGTAWLRRTFEVPAGAAGRPALIRLGIVDDTDVTYINGRRLNSTVNQRNAPRQYSIPAGMLVAGTNTIAVRISNANGRGGFAPDPAPVSGVALLAPEANQLTGMMLRGDGFTIQLGGDWKAKIEERWAGARRREISSAVPLAQQFLMANSPVADLLRSAAAAAAADGSGTDTDANTARLTLGVIAGQMKFDRTLLTARAGQRIALTVVNPDDMQHNVVIFKRGVIEQYEGDLYGSLNEPNAQLRGFVPDSVNVLVATRLLNAGESTVLTFDAPSEPGDYPFVCSFPGHWVMMRGILRIE
jgi:azurin